MKKNLSFNKNKIKNKFIKFKKLISFISMFLYEDLFIFTFIFSK